MTLGLAINRPGASAALEAMANVLNVDRAEPKAAADPFKCDEAGWLLDYAREAAVQRDSDDFSTKDNARRNLDDGAARLINFDPKTLPNQAAQRAFWINVYHALVLHGVLAFGVRTGVSDVRGFFRRTAWRINHLDFTHDPRRLRLGAGTANVTPHNASQGSPWTTP